ncbi:hypothetical protein PybrP1_010709 [[Pythium] brassicae (nom. inval.)]|nr:hypothetical protein PybrP1_010709 [[Pythium] brassicae (nom. inval.)]
MPTECLTCKPGDATLHGAAGAYERVDACMKAHNGRVSACTAEWELFRKCHASSKAAKASGDKSSSASNSAP